jgi:hypothetical protein
VTTIDWESSDSDIIAHFKQAANPSGDPVETKEASPSPIPWRFHRLDRKDTRNKFRSTVDRTVFRFYTDLRVVGTDTDYPEIAADNVYIRRQLMLSLWNDIGPIASSMVPWYLRDLPVKGFGPLSKAYGFYKNGQPDTFMLDQDKNPKWHPILGVRPLKMYWISAHVTRYWHDEETGGLVSAQSPVILLLKEWQARAMAETLNTMREMKGADWDITGFPFHILNLTLKRNTDTGLKMTPAGSFNADDKEIYDVGSLPAPNFKEQGVALLTAFDDFLTTKGFALKDFPSEGAHPDGWASQKPMAQVQYEEWKSQQSKPVDKYADRSIEDLHILAEEYGVQVRKNASREKIIEAIESSIPF